MQGAHCKDRMKLCSWTLRPVVTPSGHIQSHIPKVPLPGVLQGSSGHSVPCSPLLLPEPEAACLLPTVRHSGFEVWPLTPQCITHPNGTYYTQ